MGPTARSQGNASEWSIGSQIDDSANYVPETVANGMIGILSSPVPFRTQQTLINGAYERIFPGSVSSIARSFDFLDFHVSIDGKEIVRRDQTSEFRQRIDFQRAAFVTEFDYGLAATVSYSVRALRNLPYCGLVDVAITAHRPIMLSVRGAIDVPDPEIDSISQNKITWLRDSSNFNTRIDLSPSRRILVVSKVAKGPLRDLTIAAAQTFVFDQTNKAQDTSIQNGDLIFTHKLVPGETFRFALVGATLTSASTSDPLNEAQRLTSMTAIRGREALIQQHEADWRDLWKSDILIDGDPDMQRTVHSMLYHLYSFVRPDSGLSIPPMGLSRAVDGYYGHIFWDAETWMMPVLLALHPELARTMLDYRVDRLPAAMKNAQAQGYKGAKFPWESAATGEDDIWSWAFGVPEDHISGDIALAAWNYFRVTGDTEWLRTRGFPLIAATANFWTSRVERDPAGKFHIRHVVGADENAVDVDDDAFTNAVARANLDAATQAAARLHVSPDPSWRKIRERIVIPRFPNGTTREHRDYAGQTILQADVNLLAYPLVEVATREAIKRDLAYYDRKIDAVNGPAMTKSVLALLRARLDDPEAALKEFQEGYLPNLRPPFQTFAETASTKNSYFATGAGGVLQALLYGFGGLTISDAGIAQNPVRLPRQWKRIRMTGIGPEHRAFMSNLH